MELWQEIFFKLPKTETIEIRFPQLENAQQLIESTCYQALRKIKYILEDESLDDQDCFMKIEEIVRIFEGIGSDCGNRHDF